MPLTALDWKRYYAAERTGLGRNGLRGLVADAPDVEFPDGGALIFPHTKLRDSGRLVAGVARAVVGRDVVLALGVLHGARDAGVPRGVHGHEREVTEFSLDGFAALVAIASELAGTPPPRLVRRYPCRVGTTPADLPGAEELRALIRDGAAVVATADMVHHGEGYGTPPDQRHASDDLPFARGLVERGLELLARRDYEAYLAHCESARSDFRDAPLLVELLAPGGEDLVTEVAALSLVDYVDPVGGDPTWVAAALAAVNPATG